MAWQRLKDELKWDDVGGRLLANLAKGIYDHQAVLREYVQNACDAYVLLDSPPDEPTIVITPDGRNLTIVDYGIGMDEDDIKAVKKIAVSPKAEVAGTTGFRGIGIWAGFQACDKLVVITKKQGAKKRYRLVIDFKDILTHVDDNINIKELVDPRYEVASEPATTAEHYTQVTLQNAHTDYDKLLDPNALLEIASDILPCRIDPFFQHATQVQEILDKIPDHQEFHIKVTTSDGLKEAFRKFPTDLLDVPESITLRGEHQKVLARGWFCRSQKTALRSDVGARGFRVRLRNFAIGPVNIYSDEDGSRFGVSAATRELKSPAGLGWFCGEVHVTNSDIVPNTPRDDLEINGPARRLIEETRKFYKERIEDARAHSDFNGYKRAIDEAKVLLVRLAGKPASPGTADEEPLTRLLERFEEANNKAKGSKADGSAKAMLRELLSRASVKKERKDLIHQLRAALPKAGGATTAAKPPHPPPASSEKTKTPASQNQPSATSLAIEAIVTDVVLILEKHLGKDHDEIEGIAKEITKALESRIFTNAEQPIS